MRKSESIKLLPNEKLLCNRKTKTENFIRMNDWTHFVTLTFKYPLRDKVEAETIVTRFISILSKKSFGNRSKHRANVFPVCEHHSDGAIHIHLLIEDPTNTITNPKRRKLFNLRDAIITSWTSASSKAGNPALLGSKDWLQEVNNIDGSIRYMLKETSKSDSPVLWHSVSLQGRRDKIEIS